MSSPPRPLSPDAKSPCPCGSGQSLGECCGPILSRERPAPTAEALMRSRFTAHALRDYAHLHRTDLSTARTPYQPEKENDTNDLAWTRLIVHAHETGPTPDAAWVEFSAYYQDDGTEHVIQEKSAFQRIDGEWFYTRAIRHGPAPVKASHPKVGRNDPCSCGSGKKYKHCCLAKA